MNHRQINIAQTRHLLDMYYRGETTPEQERQLTQSLAGADPGTLPDDLRAEQPMFADLLRIMPEHERRVSIPPHIAARLTDAIDRIAVPGPVMRRRRFSLLLRLSSAAAAAVVIGLIAFNLSDRDSSVADRQMFTAERPTTGQPTASETDTTDNLSDSEAGQALRTATANNAGQFRPHRVNDIRTGNVVTITDPVQAREITDKVNGILNRAAKSRDKALNSLQSIENSNRKTENQDNNTKSNNK